MSRQLPIHIIYSSLNPILYCPGGLYKYYGGYSFMFMSGVQKFSLEITEQFGGKKTHLSSPKRLSCGLKIIYCVCDKP